MKTSLALIAAAMFTAFSSTPASASLLIYEPFDYTPSGSAIIGQTDIYSPGSPTWARAGTAAAVVHQVTTPSLPAPSGYPASVGNAGLMLGGPAGGDFNEYARMSLGAQYGASSTLFYSLLLDVPNIAGLTTAHSNLNANNDGIIAFNNNTGAGTKPSIWAGELTMRLGASSSLFNLGVRASQTAASTTYWSADLTPGLTYLVVVGYTSSATPGTGGLSSLWINPSSATFGAPVAPAADGSTVGSMNATGSNDHVDSLIIGAGIAAGADPTQTIIDEIRVGTTWGEVVPEPSALVLAGLGALSLVSWSRARRR